MFCGTKETHFKVNKLQWKKMIGYFVKPTDLIGYQQRLPFLNDVYRQSYTQAHWLRN